MNKLFRSLMDAQSARKIFLDAAKPIESIESLPIELADNRVLADDVVSETDVPHYSRSAMDGYAVKADDTMSASPSSPVMLMLTDGDIIPNTCSSVHTGSPIPRGADAVVMVEDSRIINATVEITTQVHPGKNVGEIGEDVAAGETILKAGHRLRPGDLAVLASMGIRDIEVFHKPLIAIIPTGEEVVPRGIPLEPGQVWETNSLMTASYVTRIGGIPRINDIVTDDPKLICEAIQANSDANMLIICGGTSVGKRDHVPAVIKEIGELPVHGIAISPGKPTALGIVNKKPILCMPGYPVAGFIALLAFGKDMIKKIGHIPLTQENILKLPLSEKITSRQGYETYVRVRIKDNSIVEPVMTSGAGILSSVAKADGYVVVPPNIEGYEVGTLVDVVII
ncbi:MAG: molybdopterin molybdotransferase MoeA [Methanosarcinales archaeon]|nr:molybdopterin molybdotransferase MoeA [Methanosarcinales archaeon]